MRRILFILSLMAVLLNSGCNSYDFSRREVQQGNLLPEQKISRLKLGMSKTEVAALMGTSLLSPLFNNNRWDYAYTWRRGNGPMEKRWLSLYFSKEHLTRIEQQKPPAHPSS